MAGHGIQSDPEPDHGAVAMSRILLVDDHAVLRQGLKLTLADAFPGVKFGEAGTAAEAHVALHRHRWDLVVLDINLPGRSGFEVLGEIRRELPQLPVLVLSSTPEEQIGLRSVKGGAAGFLNKRTPLKQLVAAVRKILDGEPFISPWLAQRLVEDLRRGTDAPRHEALSERELQVCQMTAGGKSIKEIAAELSLSAKTISTFRSRVFKKLGLSNDAGLVRNASEHGLATDE